MQPMPSGEPYGTRAKSALLFERLAAKTAQLTGRPSAFILSAATVIVWAATGPVFHYSDTWQLVINTGTTIVTFLMVFLIQNTQNRDQLALQLKLDELILSTKTASNAFAAIEEHSGETLQAAKEDIRSRATAEDGAAATN